MDFRRLLTGAVLLTALTLVVTLGWQVKSLRRDLRIERVRSLQPAAGQWVPPVPATTLAGEPLVIGTGPAGTAQVLFVFNTTCAFCLRTAPVWSRIASQLETLSNVRVLGWSQDSDSLTRAYVAAQGMSFTTVASTPPKYFSMYRALGVPATMVIDANGQVLYAALGMLSSAEEDSVLIVARRTS
jgi:peroxiredoxin